MSGVNPSTDRPDSLAGHVAARIRPLVPARRGGVAIRVAILLGGMMLASLAIAAALQARGALIEAGALADRGATAVRDRERLSTIADALAVQPLDAQLSALRARLPGDARLAEASRGEDGMLRIAIDTPDPDALRAGLAGDPRLGRFRERGQAMRGDGTIRVTLVGDMG